MCHVHVFALPVTTEADKDDSGQYAIQLTNNGGTAETKFNLKVKGTSLKKAYVW